MAIPFLIVTVGCAGGSLEATDGAGGSSGDATLGDAGSPADGDHGTDCPESACEIGQPRCAGRRSVVRCESGPNGCGSFTRPEPCPDDQICENGRCVDPAGCIDNDGDGYGRNCRAGPDCDDENDQIHPGADEICGDGIDNNCSGEADEDCSPGCDDAPCMPGETRCDGGRLERCSAADDGCGVWAGPMPCPGGGTCSGGRCEGCQDGDGDGYGPNCGGGQDCDDSDPDTHPGARELCDGRDNDCDGRTDEDFSRKGGSCSAGMGACRRQGTYRCSPSGRGLECTATPGTGGPELCRNGTDDDCDGSVDEGFGIVGSSCSRGTGECRTTGRYECDPDDRTTTTCGAPTPGGGSREICDAKDNDCDGQTDENGVCTRCVEDSYEPNQNSSSGTPLKSARTLDGINSCGGCGQGSWDWDWFDLGVHDVGDRVKIELRHPTGTNAAGERWGNLDVEMFCGSNFCDAIRGTSGTTSGTFDGTCTTGTQCTDGQRWTMHVYPRCGPNPNGNPASGTPYSLRRF